MGERERFNGKSRVRGKWERKREKKRERFNGRKVG